MWRNIFVNPHRPTLILFDSKKREERLLNPVVTIIDLLINHWVAWVQFRWILRLNQKQLGAKRDVLIHQELLNPYKLRLRWESVLKSQLKSKQYGEYQLFSINLKTVKYKNDCKLLLCRRLALNKAVMETEIILLCLQYLQLNRFCLI